MGLSSTFVVWNSARLRNFGEPAHVAIPALASDPELAAQVVPSMV
jgi:hypothetical protein